MRCDAVFEGGGVKGIAFVGAIRETEERGYRFERLAGTSAGSLVASLLAAGYTGEELEHLLGQMPFSSFLKKKGFGRIPLLGDAYNLLVHAGMFSTQELYRWVDERLRQKGVRYFGDLKGDRLKIIASDITRGRMMVLPDDLEDYGLSPNKFPIALAVTMSCAIPFFFQPAVLMGEKNERIYVVDGGLLSNFPVWIFDRKNPRWPTFGYRLEEAEGGVPYKIRSLFSLCKALVHTALEAHDRMRLREQDAVRTISIPIKGIKATDFNLSEEQKKELVQLGKEEAKRFFDRWSFQTYLARYGS